MLYVFPKLFPEVKINNQRIPDKDSTGSVLYGFFWIRIRITDQEYGSEYRYVLKNKTK